MEPLELTFTKPDWIFIRQALSLALLKNRPVRIAGVSGFFHDESRHWPLYEDIRKTVALLGAGELKFSGGVIEFTPAPIHFGRRVIETGKFSSIPELVLFLAPALSALPFRTILNLSGVTHSCVSFSSSEVKETLFSLMESSGLYCSYAIRRFGFYGSGGGLAEARVYPSECIKQNIGIARGGASISGARVLVSGLSSGLAKQEKDILCAALGIPVNRVTILEVLDSDGFGNSVDIHLDMQGLRVVLSKEMRIYTHAGDFIFDAEDCFRDLDGLIGEAREAAGGVFPEKIAREIVPYARAGGSRFIESKSELILETEDLCRKLLF